MPPCTRVIAWPKLRPMVGVSLTLKRLFSALREGARATEEQGHPAVLVVSPSIRSWLAKAARYRVHDLTLMSYSEIPDDQSVKVIHTIHAEPR